jgi:tetratricopeptide (TPR) repeat protein
MKIMELCSLSMLLFSGVCVSANDMSHINAEPDTTASIIAIVNLDQQIAELGDNPGVEDLLILREELLADYDALDRASALAEGRFLTAQDLLKRAQTRAAVHRFADALSDLESAQQHGVSPDQILPLRASILIATGHASEVVAQLKKELIRNPSFASRSMLATAYAAMGRVDEADRLYAAALADLNTTLPFPYAWIYFGRGLMWAEQGQNPARAEAMYTQALAYVPEFAASNISLAKLEMARGDNAAARKRISQVARSTNHPEALALLGVLDVRNGDLAQGNEEISRARQRFESLLVRYPLGFADHAAEFYLGPGHDPERAWLLAKQNLGNRETDRSVALAVKAAEATGRYQEACDLLRNHGPLVQVYLKSLERVLTQ